MRSRQAAAPAGSGLEQAVQRKKWRLRGLQCGSDTVLKLSQTYKIPPVVTAILLKRGIDSFDEFIYPELERLYDPYLMKGMKAAADRIIAAINKGEQITVYGDYDVDGITSTAALVRFLRSRGARALYYIPDRLREGYGLNNQAIDSIAASGTTLLITVDCGITAVNEVQYAKESGIDVVISDHHECKEQLPEAHCILNPKQPGCPYPFKKLAGVGVVFKLLQALTLEMKFHMKELFDEYIDLVSLGTVADVMPLVGENRILVKNGLKQIRYTANRGVSALIRQAEINPEHITAGTIGFMLAPRINAAGRIGDPKCAVELLLSADDKTAEAYAKRLDEANRDRQAAELNIFEEAVSMIEGSETLKKDSVLVLAKEGWHHGIIGIVASKVTEKFNKPCILISLDEAVGKGSGRSIKGFNLFAALTACNGDLIKFGGHELAAGLTVAIDQIETFRRHINVYGNSVLNPEDFIPEITIDAELPLKYMNLNTVEKFSVMAPYGMGNASPVFLCRKLHVSAMQGLSDGRHIRLSLSEGDVTAEAIGFSMGELLHELRIGDLVDIVFNLDANVYRGERRVQILLKDLRYFVRDA